MGRPWHRVTGEVPLLTIRRLRGGTGLVVVELLEEPRAGRAGRPSFRSAPASSVKSSPRRSARGRRAPDSSPATCRSGRRCSSCTSAPESVVRVFARRRNPAGPRRGARLRDTDRRHCPSRGGAGAGGGPSGAPRSARRRRGLADAIEALVSDASSRARIVAYGRTLVRDLTLEAESPASRTSSRAIRRPRRSLTPTPDAASSSSCYDEHVSSVRQKLSSCFPASRFATFARSMRRTLGASTWLAGRRPCRFLCARVSTYRIPANYKTAVQHGGRSWTGSDMKRVVIPARAAATATFSGGSRLGPSRCHVLPHDTGSGRQRYRTHSRRSRSRAATPSARVCHRVGPHEWPIRSSSRIAGSSTKSGVPMTQPVMKKWPDHHVAAVPRRSGVGRRRRRRTSAPRPVMTTPTDEVVGSAGSPRPSLRSGPGARRTFRS